MQEENQTEFVNKKSSNFIRIISVIILLFILACFSIVWYTRSTALDHDIENGINYRFYNNSNTFDYIFYAKRHKYSGFYYDFYQNGNIHSVRNYDVMNSPTLIYNPNGELVGHRYCIYKMNINNKEYINTYIYKPLDSSFTAIVNNGYIRLKIGSDTMDIEIPKPSGIQINQSDYFIYKKADSLRIDGLHKIKKLTGDIDCSYHLKSIPLDSLMNGNTTIIK